MLSFNAGIRSLKSINVDRPFVEKHYEDLSAKPFFSGLVDYIISGPVVAMIWEGKNVILTGRKIIGATNPAESAPGTILIYHYTYQKILFNCKGTEFRIENVIQSILVDFRLIAASTGAFMTLLCN
ncbi:hypothetical protein ACE6H2_006310 [Prunus campanulata]